MFLAGLKGSDMDMNEKEIAKAIGPRVSVREVLDILRDKNEHLKQLRDEKKVKELEIAELDKAIKFLEGVRDKPTTVISFKKCEFPGCTNAVSAGHDRCEQHFYKHSPKEKVATPEGAGLEELK